MSAQGSVHDRGLRAVERVRAVRERDSRLGLQQAVAERDRLQTRLRLLEERLAGTAHWNDGDTWSYLALRSSLLALGEAITAAQGAVAGAERIAETAQAHWSSDKTRLSAVENLVERRMKARRAERARLESRELDDIAAQLWIRQQEDSP